MKPKPDRVLLLMGGGKDSLYSYELLRAAGLDVECFYMTEACRTWQQLRRTHARLAGEAVQHRAFLDANQAGRLEARFGRNYPTQFQIGQALFLSVPYGRQFVSRASTAATAIASATDPNSRGRARTVRSRANPRRARRSWTVGMAPPILRSWAGIIKRSARRRGLARADRGGAADRTGGPAAPATRRAKDQSSPPPLPTSCARRTSSLLPGP